MADMEQYAPGAGASTSRSSRKASIGAGCFRSSGRRSRPSGLSWPSSASSCSSSSSCSRWSSRRLSTSGSAAGGSASGSWCCCSCTRWDTSSRQSGKGCPFRRRCSSLHGRSHHAEGDAAQRLARGKARDRRPAARLGRRAGDLHRRGRLRLELAEGARVPRLLHQPLQPAPGCAARRRAHHCRLAPGAVAGRLRRPARPRDLEAESDPDHHPDLLGHRALESLEDARPSGDAGVLPRRAAPES